VITRDIPAYLGSSWSNCTGLMRKLLGSEVALLDTTNLSLLSNSGKMLRPMLAMLMGKACGRLNTDTERIAAAVELLHNATLMHDDVVDDSMERRGKPTLKALLGSPAAVLVGDFWLAKSMECLLDCGMSSRDRAFRLFGQTMVDLSEGEMLQMEKAERADTTEKDYVKIVFCKTASLFVAACVSAAISVGASEEYVAAARSYATSAGIAFQIKDDILDYSGDDSIGKPLGIDLMEHKITLPLLCALEASPQESVIREAVRTIGEHPENCELVRAFVEENCGVEKATARLNEYIEKAVRSLDVLPDTEAKGYLVQTARFIGNRNK